MESIQVTQPASSLFLGKCMAACKEPAKLISGWKTDLKSAALHGYAKQQKCWCTFFSHHETKLLVLLFGSPKM